MYRRLKFRSSATKYKKLTDAWITVVLLIPLKQWRRKLLMHARTGGKDMRHYSYFNNLTTRDLRYNKHRFNFFYLVTIVAKTK